MGKLIFLGTCSGTEPMPGRHHTATVLELGGQYYWFDAGENCSHMATTMGLDISRVRAVFLTHMHIDHIGGLANLIFSIYKTSHYTGVPHINGNSYDIFAPDPEKLRAVREIATAYRDPGYVCVRPREHRVRDGLVFDDGNLRVTAMHNTHLHEDGRRGWHSYSYLLECGGRRIVLSGDVSTPEELNAFVDAGCDLLLMETGHHGVADVCAYAKAHGVGRLLFTHHGREILDNPPAAAACAAAFGLDAHVCNDGDIEIF